MRADVSKVNYGFFCQESMVHEISKHLYGNDSVLSNVTCDLENTENY